jgi:hypothetical protein
MMISTVSSRRCLPPSRGPFLSKTNGYGAARVFFYTSLSGCCFYSFFRVFFPPPLSCTKRKPSRLTSQVHYTLAAPRILFQSCEKQKAVNGGVFELIFCYREMSQFAKTLRFFKKIHSKTISGRRVQ